MPQGAGLRVLGIPEDLRTAIINVLDNAVKYSPEGVHLRCSLAIARSTSVTLLITDRGMGLPPNQNKRIFRRFYRGDETRSKPGCGLGLAIVAAIVRLHGFSLSVGGGEKGAVFSVTCPAI